MGISATAVFALPHHLYLYRAHTHTHKHLHLALLTHPKIGHTQHLNSVQTTNAQVDSSDHVGSDPERGTQLSPAVQTERIRGLTETRPRIQPLFPSLKEVFKARHGLQAVTMLSNNAQSVTLRNVGPWPIWLDLGYTSTTPKSDVFLPLSFRYLSGSWLIFPEHEHKAPEGAAVLWDFP